MEVNFHPNTFFGEVLSSEIEENLRKKGVHLYRSTRLAGGDLSVDGIVRVTKVKLSAFFQHAIVPTK